MWVRRGSSPPTRCDAPPTPTCAALWTARSAGRLRASGWAGAQPVVVDGVVYVGSTGGSLYVFPAWCRGTCEPSGVLDLSGPLANRCLYGDTLYVTAGQDLDAIPTRCLATGASCGARWIGRATSLIVSMPQIDDGNVFVGSRTGRSRCFRSRVVMAGGCASLVVDRGTRTAAESHGRERRPLRREHVGRERALRVRRRLRCSRGACEPLCTTYRPTSEHSSSHRRWRKTAR